MAAERAGLLAVAEEAARTSRLVERSGLSPFAADGLMLAQRLLAVPERVGAATLVLGWKGGARKAQAEFIREGMWPRTVA